MSLTDKDIEHVANLARLQVFENEKRSLAGELSRILEYAGDLQRLDLTGVEPTSHVGVKESVMRSDEPSPSLPAEVALANAPDTDEQQFRVPAVLEG